MATHSITMHGAMQPRRGGVISTDLQTRTRAPAAQPLRPPASPVRARPCLAPLPAWLRLAAAALTLLANVLVIGGVLGLFAWGG